MRLIHQSNKKVWAITVGCLAAAFISFLFLPENIVVHFSGSMPDGYADKALIFLFPCLQALLLSVGEIKSFQYWCIYCKTAVKTKFQYYMILFSVITIIAFFEVIVIFFSFSQGAA